MGRGDPNLRGGAVPTRARLTARRLLALMAAFALPWFHRIPTARADLGADLQAVERALAGQARHARLPPRLVERGESSLIVLPPWALDDAQGACTTLVVLSPPPTQLVLRLHPWPGQPDAYPSGAGALQVTRCGAERATLMRVLLEMRSPRAVVHALVAVGPDEPPPLTQSLPARDAGPAAPPGDPGPPPPRQPLGARLARFEEVAKRDGARAVRSQPLPRIDFARIPLEPGCHRLLVTAPDEARPFALLLTENVEQQPRSLPSQELPDVRDELCTARQRTLYLRVVAPSDELDRTLILASFALPDDVPGRFGPELAEKLTLSLGGSRAPRRLGKVVLATLGAQGHTPLPRSVLPQTCYVAAAVVARGQPQQLSLGVRTAGRSQQATSDGAEPGPRVAFCTGARPEVDLDVEGRGLGLAWLLVLFQAAPARPSVP